MARGAEVHFERAGDADGTNWLFSSSVVGGVRDIIPSGIALRVVAGLPRIAFWHGQGGDVYYTESAFANGGSWKVPARIIFGSGTAGGSVALLDDGDLEITGANARKPGGGSWAIYSEATREKGR